MQPRHAQRRARTRIGGIGGAGGLIVLAGFLGITGIPWIPGRELHAQIKSPGERIDELEEANRDLLRRLDTLEKDLGKAKTKAGQEAPAGTPAGASKDAAEPFYADGVLTLGGVKLHLGGEISVLLVDPQSENDPVVGATENPDPHLELNRFRLEPSLIFSNEISAKGQIDLRPERGDSYLRELTARYDMTRPAWWFDLRSRIGIDDRFMFLDRVTKTYPLVGSAFWHRESLGLDLELRFGDRAGPPDPGPVEPLGELDQSLDSVVVVRREAPFDFLKNPGELGLFFSIGQGYTLRSDEIGNDGASFSSIVADGRDLESSAALREVGVGLRYRRDFLSLGELSLFGYYFNDELSDASLDYLENDLTVVVGGIPQKGYGTLGSTSRDSERYGAHAEYFLPASTIFGKDADVRRRDGLRLAAQWMRGFDGELRRDGWFVQGSYRYSFPTATTGGGGRSRGLIAGRYFRSLEPVVRYGALDVNLDPTPELPGLWDRRELLLGLVVEVTSEVFFRIEYLFNGEKTGAGASEPGPSRVDNDQLLVELLLLF